MSRLKQEQKYSPQQGRFSVRLKDRSQDISVVSFPTINGDSLVLHMESMSKTLPFSFEQLSLSPENKIVVSSILKRAEGLFLVVGKSKSGKSTTLHALLNELNTDERKIWTAEDEIEITQPGIQQVKTNPLIGFDYKVALNSFLYADPDVILVGKLSDRDTANLAVDVASKGHFILSSVDAVSAVSSIKLLLNLEINSSRFSDVFQGVLAQKMVKTLCAECKTEMSESEKQQIHELYSKNYSELEKLGSLKLFKASGCAKCDDTGYEGQAVLHELLVVSDPLRNLMKRNASEGEIVKLAEKEGIRTFMDDAIQKLINGQIDLAQLVSIDC